jgi:hypothetical protein
MLVYSKASRISEPLPRPPKFYRQPAMPARITIASLNIQLALDALVIVSLTAATILLASSP